MDLFNNQSILDLQYCENCLHEKASNNFVFRKHYQEFTTLINKAVKNDAYNESISESLRKICISAETVVYKEGVNEGIRFIINTLSNPYISVKSSKRVNDFKKAFERFLAEYKMDRIADTYDFLENDPEYIKIHSDKVEKEKALQAVIIDSDMNMVLLDYITAAENLIENVKTMFYEHGFQDCVTISSAMKNGLDGISLHTLPELDIE